MNSFHLIEELIEREFTVNFVVEDKQGFLAIFGWWSPQLSVRFSRSDFITEL